MHVLDRDPPPPDAVLSYADRPTAAVDLYSARRARIGSIVLIHGGFWRAAYDRVHLRSLAAGLASEGFDVALPEYRRVGDIGGGNPGTIEDAKQILREVPGLIGCLPGAVIVAGHSAGGHLAVLAAASTVDPPKRVVSLAGVLDVRAASEARLSNDAVGELLGNGHPADEALAAIDPMNVSLPLCDVTVVHGADDADVPVAYSEAYAARAERFRLDVIAGADHYDLIDPESFAFARVLSAVKD